MNYRRHKLSYTSTSRMMPNIPSTSRLDAFWPTFRGAVVWMQRNQETLNMAVNLLEIYPTLMKQKMCERLSGYISRVKFFNNVPSSKKQNLRTSNRKTGPSTRELKIPEIHITKDFDDEEGHAEFREKETSRIFICGDKMSERWSALVVALSEHFYVRCSPNPESASVIEADRLLLENQAFIFLMDDVTVNNASYIQQLRFAAEAGMRIFCVREPYFSLALDLYHHPLDNDNNFGSPSISFGKKRDSSKSLRSHVLETSESRKLFSEKAYLTEQKQLELKQFPLNAIDHSLQSVSSQSFPVGSKYGEASPPLDSKFGIKPHRYRISSAKSDSLLVGRSLQPASPGLVPYQCFVSPSKTRHSSLFKALRPSFCNTSSGESPADHASYHRDDVLLTESFRQALVYSRSSHEKSLEIILQSIEGHDVIDDCESVVLTDCSSVSNENTSGSRTAGNESAYGSEYCFPFNEITSKGIKVDSSPGSPSTKNRIQDFSKETAKSKSHSVSNIDALDAESHLDSGLSSPTEAATVYIVFPPHRSGQSDVPKIVRCPSENDMESLPSVGSSGFQDVDLSISVNQLDWSSDESY